MKVAFRHFWDNFDPDSFFLPLLKAATGSSWTVAPERESQLLVDSVFIRRWDLALESQPVKSLRHLKRSVFGKDGTMSKRIWYTGENIRPPFQRYDATISFDIDTYGGTNFYLPLAVKELDWSKDLGLPSGFLSRTQRGTTRPTPDVVSAERPVPFEPRPKFACAFIGNPHPIRMRAIQALRTLGTVDVFGRAVGRPVADKERIAQDYTFMVCFENDVYPGYVTEKLIDSYSAGCIPLWWGNDAARLLNRNAFMNAAEFDTLGEFVREVQRVGSSTALQHEILTQPLFCRRPSLGPLIGFLTQSLAKEPSGELL